MYFKLMNKAYYGKTIENLYNRQDVELVNDVDRYIKLVENIGFNYSVEFDDDLVAVHKTRGNAKLDKFNYIGFVILEKAKLFMYKAIYDYFEKELDYLVQLVHWSFSTLVQLRIILYQCMHLILLIMIITYL